MASPQSLRTGDFALQHVTHSHPHGFMADTFVVVLTVPWVALLRGRRHTHTHTHSVSEAVSMQNP